MSNLIKIIIIAPYIQGCLSEEDLDEMNIEVIRNTLYKAYYEDFFAFCKQLGGTTTEIMSEILMVFSSFFWNFH